MRRQITRADIHYRNTTLLAKFVHETGKIYNKYQTRLMTTVQRKVARTIKKARHLGLLPHVGLINPTHKISLGSFMEDIEEMHKKQIDPLTGRMILKTSVQDDLREKLERQKGNLEKRFEGVETNDEFEKGKQDVEEKDNAIRDL